MKPGLLWTHPNDYSVELDFLKGRLYYIGSNLDRAISPSDAKSYDSNILKLLGKPQVVNYRGPDNREWVWIDHDVRIKYSDRLSDRENSDKRSVGLELAIYPALMAASHGNSVMGDLKSLWGDGGPRLVRPLPKAYDGVNLGMTPSQVQAVIPGIRIVTDDYDYGRSIGTSSPKGELNLAEFNFWDGHLLGFTRTHHGDDNGVLKAMPSKLIQQLGTPTELHFFQRDHNCQMGERDRDAHISNKFGSPFGISGDPARQEARIPEDSSGDGAKAPKV